MWRGLVAGTVILSWLLGATRSRADESAQQIIAQAERYSGGAHRLARTQLLVRSARGLKRFFGREVSFTTHLTIAFPDRLRDEIEVQVQAGSQARIIRVLNGDKGWQSSAGAVNEMAKPELDEVKEEMYALWLATLVPLQSPAFTLTALPEAKLGDRPADAVLVTSSGRPDVTLYFDQRSHALAKMYRRAREAGVSVNKEYWFSDLREWAGIRLPMKQVEIINGTKSLELTITSYDFPGRVDERTFAKP